MYNKNAGFYKVFADRRVMLEGFGGQVGGLEVPWRHLGGAWRLLEAPGGILEALGGILEASWRLLEGLGGILEALGLLLAGSWRPSAEKRHYVASVR